MESRGRKRTEVVAGLICRNDRVLVCQRSCNAAFPLKWEFPGGKVERREQLENALRRELREELGIEIDNAEKIRHYQYTYTTGFKVNLTFFRIKKYRGRLKNLVFQKIVWVKFTELLQFDFLEGDLILIQELVDLGAARLLTMPLARNQ